MSAITPLEKALAARLKGDSTLMAMLPGGVHTGIAPQTSARPYLTMGAGNEQEARTLDHYGADLTMELDTFSPSGVNSYLQVNTILDRVELLLRTPLTLENHGSARAKKDLRTTLVEDDGTRHGMLRVRVFTLETAPA